MPRIYEEPEAFAPEPEPEYTLTSQQAAAILGCSVVDVEALSGDTLSNVCMKGVRRYNKEEVENLFLTLSSKHNRRS